MGRSVAFKGDAVGPGHLRIKWLPATQKPDDVIGFTNTVEWHESGNKLVVNADNTNMEFSPVDDIESVAVEYP